jgi:hypothetical protein
MAIPQCLSALALNFLSQVSSLSKFPLPRVTPHPCIIVLPFQRHRQPSPSALSKSSDNGQNITARVAALEERMNRLEEWRAEDPRWKKLVDHRLKDAGL